MFFNYLAAVTKHWIPLLLGVFGSLPWWTRSLFSPQFQAKIDSILNPSALKLLAIFCITISFVWANYLAWEDGQKNISSLAERIDTFTKPRLIGSIEMLASGDTPELHGTQVFLMTSIKNTGTPSIAERFTLSVKNDKLNLQNIQPTFIPEGFKLINNSETIAEFHRSDALEDKAQVPIQQGAVIRGWLRFVLKDVKAEDTRGNGTKFTIHFADYLGGQYSADKDSIGKGDENIMYYPGSGQPFSKIPKENK